MKIRVSDSDLYNLSINLIDRVDIGFDAPCPRQTAPEPKPGILHRAAPAPPPELDAVRADMNRLSGEVRDFMARLQGLKELEAKLNRNIEDVTSELDLRVDRAMRQGPSAKIENLISRIDELSRESSARAGEPDRVRRIEKDLAAILAQRPGNEALDELASRLAELSERAAEKKDLDRAAAEIAEVKAGAADLKLLDEIHSGLAAMETGKASRKDLAEVAGKIEELKEAAVDLSAIDALSEKIEDLRAASAERVEVEKALSGLKELSESAADRESLEKVSASVEALRAKSAGRVELEEVAEKLELFIADAALSKDLSALASRVSGLDERAAGKTELSDVAKTLEALSERAAERTALAEVKQALADLSERAADRAALGEVKKSLEDLAQRAAEQTALGEVKSSLDALSARAADRKVLEETSAALHELAGKAAAREAMEELAKSLAALREKSAELKDVNELSARVDDLAARAAPRTDMEQVSREVDSMGSRMAEREMVNNLEIQLTDLRRRSADRETMEALSASLEQLKSQAVNREQLGKLLEMFKDLSARTADRELAGNILAEVISVKESAPSRDDLEKLSARVEEMSGRFAGRADLDNLGSLLSELKGRVLDRAELKKFLEQFKELSGRWAERDGLNEVQTRVEEIRGTLREMDKSYASLKERLAVEAADKSMDTGLRDRLVEIEKELSDLREVSLRTDVVPEVEQRLMALEKVTFAKSAGAAAAAGGPEAKPAEVVSIKGMERVAERIKKIETEHEDLRRQIIKAFENLSAYPLRELNELKDKIKELEKAAQRPMPRVVPPPGRVMPPQPPSQSQHWTDRLTKMKGMRLVAGIMIAVTAGLLSLWLTAAILGWNSNLSATATSPPGAADERPNTDYDNGGNILETPTLDMATSKISLTNGKTAIYGSAPGAVKVLLFVNSQLIGETQVVDGSFTFPDIQLEYGRNAIQVRAEDTGKNGLNSLAEIFDRISLEAAKVDPGQVINRMRGPKDRPYLCLTLDAGASDHRANEILDVLNSKGIKTTFFLTGQFIERYPDTAMRIVNEGHEIGNHTYTHPHLTTYDRTHSHQTHPGMSRERLMNELVRTRDQFERVTQHKMSHWWRAPYGEYNSSILTWAKEAGFDHIDWTRSPQNLDMLDWIADPKDPHYLKANALLLRLTTIDNGVANKANGGIILCHLGSDRTGDYLDGILGEAIDTLRGRHYQFVTVSQMFGEAD